MPNLSFTSQTNSLSTTSQQAVNAHPVYTMPEKFLQPIRPASSPRSRVVIIAVVVALIVISIAIGVYVYTTTKTSTTDTKPSTQSSATTPPLDINVSANTTNTNTTQNSSIVLNVNATTNSQVTINNSNTTANTNSTAINHSQTPTDQINVPSSPDKDRDQLTDIEEDLYGTKNFLPDSDTDGFIDGVEVARGYSPVTADESMAESGLVLEYNNVNPQWKIDYPAAWLAEAVPGDDTEVLLTPTDVEGEFISIVTTDNPEHYSAFQWYASLYPTVSVADIDTKQIGELEAVVSPDGLRYYIATENHLISIIDHVEGQDVVAFKTTLSMIVASFTITTQTTVKNQASNQASPTSTTNESRTNDNTTTNNAGTSTVNSLNDVNSALGNTNRDNQAGLSQ